MSFSSRHRYKTRREKNKTTANNFRMIIIAAIIGLIVILYKNRISILDYLKTYFY